ncbi:hypothetical protein [Ruegeria arenilitoris]
MVELGAQAHLVGATHDRVQAAKLGVKRGYRPDSVRFLCVESEALGLRI